MPLAIFLHQEKIDYLHIDVIDGKYAPDFTMGTSIINCFRDIFEGPFDHHLMVEEPSNLFDTFEIRPGDRFCMHPECCRNLHRDLIELRKKGAEVGVALSPATPISVLDYVIEDLDFVLLMTVNPGFGGQKYIPYSADKIQRLRKMLNDRGLTADIQVDGGISAKTIDQVLEAGANILVAGSAVFGGDILENTKALTKKIEEFRNRQ